MFGAFFQLLLLPFLGIKMYIYFDDFFHFTEQINDDDDDDDDDD